MKKYNNYSNKLEWLKRNKKYLKYFDNSLFNSNIEYVEHYLNNLTNLPTSSQHRMIELICDLSILYDTSIIDIKINEYKNENKIGEKIKIRYGDAAMIYILKN